MSYITGDLIKKLREEKHLTQNQLAEMLRVSDKTISKWETGRGLPDIGILPILANILQVSIAELLAGEHAVNQNRAGNPRKCMFYICPVCGNILFSFGAGDFSCHGIQLPPLEAEEADLDHTVETISSDGEYYFQTSHSMDKDHYLTFAAMVTDDTIILKKLYPEQNAAFRFPKQGNGMIFWCCNRHGLFEKKLKNS